MLRKFKISIDGQEYLVEMEEIGGVPQSQSVAPTTSEMVAPAATSTPKPVSSATQPTPSTATNKDAIVAPMPGTILKVLVKAGETVTENQPVMILEAMKMENEVVAPKAGTVIDIQVAQGQMVNPGDALITIQ